MRENTDQKNSEYRRFSRGHDIGDKLHIRDPNYKNWLRKGKNIEKHSTQRSKHYQNRKW